MGLYKRTLPTLRPSNKKLPICRSQLQVFPTLFFFFTSNILKSVCSLYDLVVVCNNARDEPGGEDPGQPAQAGHQRRQQEAPILSEATIET